MRAGADDTLGVILAGGAGTRVGGADKGLLPLRGRPLVEHVLERLRPQCDRVLIVANRDLDDYARYAPVVHDENGGHAGPLAGLIATFGFLEANRHALPCRVLTAPVDCPDPARDLAARLHSTLMSNETIRCVYVHRAGQPQPLFAMYRIDGEAASWRVPAQAALRSHGSPLRWHVEMGATAVDFDDASEAFHNLNTPEDFREYERSHD